MFPGPVQAIVGEAVFELGTAAIQFSIPSGLITIIYFLNPAAG
jgi:hypothetical protein